MIGRLKVKLIEDNYLDKDGKIFPEYKFKFNHPTLKIQNSKFIGKPEDKFETMLFLPEGEGRKGEGGLRTKGYFKFSYVWRGDGDCESDSDGSRKWWITDLEGNPVMPAPEEIQKSINKYINTLSSQNESNKSENPKSNIQNPKFHKLPLITVITVVLNGEKYLEQTIQSVINQTYPNVEYIIIDGGSTDGTLDIIKKYEDYIDYWVSEKDRGIYDAMNKGIKLAKGEWVGVLGSDDWYELDTMESFVQTGIINSNKEVSVLYGDSIVYYETEIVYRRKTPNNPKRILKEFIFIHPDSIAKLELYKKIGLYKQDLKLAADYEFFIRAYLSGYNFMKITKTVLNYRLGGFSYNYKKAFSDSFKIFTIYKFKLSPLFLPLRVVALLKSVIKKFLKISENSNFLKIYRRLKYDIASYKDEELEKLIRLYFKQGYTHKEISELFDIKNSKSQKINQDRFSEFCELTSQ